MVPGNIQKKNIVSPTGCISMNIRLESWKYFNKWIHPNGLPLHSWKIISNWSFAGGFWYINKARSSLFGIIRSWDILQFNQEVVLSSDIGQHHRVHIIWAILYGSYDMRHIFTVVFDLKKRKPSKNYNLSPRCRLYYK